MASGSGHDDARRDPRLAGRHSLSPRMHNAAFAALGLDWAYVVLPTPPTARGRRAGLAALGFAGANVTTPHKVAVTAFCETDVPSVNTLVVRDGRVEGRSDRCRDPRRPAAGEPGRPRRRGRGRGVHACAPARAAVRAARYVAARRRRRRPRRQRDVRARRGRSSSWRGADARRPPVPGDGDGRRGATSGRERRHRPRGARRTGRRLRSSSGPGSSADRGHEGRPRLTRVTLTLTTAGESHGPALVAIVTGLPAGLRLDRDAIDADLHRRRQGYGRSPRQKLEEDEVEVLAGLRHGLHARNAARARHPQSRSRELGVGDEPVAARRASRPARGRRRSRFLDRGTPTSPARSSSATTTFATRSSGRARARPRSRSRPAPSRSRCSREIGVEVAGRVLEIGGADSTAGRT